MEQFLHDISWVVPLRTPELTVFFNGLTWLGYTTFFLIFLPLGYWLWDKHMFTRLAVLIIITGLINGFVKDLFHDPRPPVQFALDPRTAESYGFPSGHAQVAFAMWLWLAYEIRRTWAWIAAILIAVGVCASRVYLGVHDLEDIIGGSLLGLATIFAYRTLVSDEFKFWHNANPLLQLAVILAIQPLVWFIWPGTKGPGGNFALFGFLFGWWLGVVIERKWIHFARPSNWIVGVGIAVVAVAALVLSFKPLGQLLMGLGVAKVAAQWIQTAIIGIYTTAFVPLLMRVTRVSQTTPA
ncbi:MAG: phosphatase PAP2 family protein [Alphaproteobacteria bacterium]|nr:phosphatase PAP2 family protein [Alphaproteobacteria bacterium]